MKTPRKIAGKIYLAVAGMFILIACRKELSVSSGAANASTSPTIAVAASSSALASSANTDSVYFLQSCANGSKRDSIAQSSLPSAVTDYLSSNYAGYLFYKAFAIVNSSGDTTAYVVIIYYNDKPVGLKFDANGNFIQVLEQREKEDLEGDGWHHDGRFDDRDGRQRDTLALSALPETIQAYFTGNYPQDTLIKAFVNKDGSYFVISRNNGLFATIFDASGNFVKRVDFPTGKVSPESVDASALPAPVTDYLSTTYRDYVFKKAFAIKDASGALQGYVVFIDANNTKYAVLFDASGNFVSARTIC